MTEQTGRPELEAGQTAGALEEAGRGRNSASFVPPETAALALWCTGLRERSNETFFPLFFDEHRYLVLKGGGGSGKSVFAAAKLGERCLCEPGHRFLVCRKVARTLKESCFRLLERLITERGVPGVKFLRSEPAIRFPNGSEILFAGLDDVEKLKSIADVTGIWIEEASELSEDDFRQLDIRLRGETRYYKQIILSFNPVSANHWLKRRFFDQADTRARVHESTYLDNRFLDEEAVRTLEGFRASGEDDYYYQVYCLGHWGVPGGCVFNAAEVQRRLDDDVQPRRVGYFLYEGSARGLTALRWAEDARNGFIRVYAEPEPGAPYVIGCDTAGEGSDCFVAQVIDNRSGRQVAVLRQRTDEDLFAKQVWCLGCWYNWALVGVEANFSTYPILELERLRYPKQYVRETVDNYTHRTRRSYGFRTDSRTRPLILAGLVQALRDDPDCVCDRDTLFELLTFVRSEASGRPEAAPGAHDDCVMALAIAHGIRGQQSYFTAPGGGARLPGASPRPTSDEGGFALPEVPVPASDGRGFGRHWTESQWEDWRGASPEEREMLARKWG